jgi:hypothetical protein
MRRGLCRIGWLLGLILAVPAPAADKDKPDQASEQDYRALPQNGDIIGRLKHVDPTDKTFTLEIDVSLLRAKGGSGTQAARLLQQQERILRQEQDILRTRSKALSNPLCTACRPCNPWTYGESQRVGQTFTTRNPVVRAEKAQRLAAELERDRLQELKGQNTTRAVTRHKDFDLESGAEAEVRRQDPPVQYDDKGQVKKYTPKELQELKGDAKLPGYQADWTDLKPGQSVKVTLVKPKGKDKDNKKGDARPQASLILVIKDAPDADAKKK